MKKSWTAPKLSSLNVDKTLGGTWLNNPETAFTTFNNQLTQPVFGTS